MKNNISRQYIYLIILSFVLFIFVLIFAFGVLIPKGKEYRIGRNNLQKADRFLRKEKKFETKITQNLKELQHSNRRAIKAFDATFDPKQFEKENKKFFLKLSLTSVDFKTVKKDFAIYEVNTTSQIDSPASFYKFLDSINKSDWIISVQFPINFQRKEKTIDSSFKMRVYRNNRDTNATASSSKAK